MEIKIPFGKDVYMKTISPILHNTSISDTEVNNQVEDVLTKLLTSTLRSEGYSQNAIGRLFFEEALDYYVKINMKSKLVKYLKIHKVPKFFILKISDQNIEE